MSLLSKSDFEMILAYKLGDRKFELISFEQIDAGDVSQGFMSSVNRVDVYYKIENVIEKLSVFVKILGSIHEGGLTKTLFKREEDVFNLFLRNIDKEMNDFFPSCYLAKDSVLVLEDLSLSGFKNLEILEPCDREHCLKIAECLAKLHTASLICERKRKRKLNELIPGLEKELIFSKEETHVGRKRHFVGVNALRRFAEVYLPQYPKDIVSKAFDTLTALPENLDPSTRYPNTLCHGDLWNNNIMFSYDSNGQVSKASLIDFQVSSYKPPTFDLQVFMFCCTNQEVRRKHLDEIKRHYFERFQYHLNQANIDPNGLMSWEVFVNMYKETLPTTLGLAPQFMHFVGVPVHFLKPIIENTEKWKHFYEVDRNDFVLQVASKSLIYKDKIIEGLKDFFDYFLQCS